MDIQIDPKRLEQFNAAKLTTGSGNASTGQGCALNWGNYLAGGTGLTDDHECVSRPIRRVLIRLNDKWGDADRQLLKPYVLRALGTAGTTMQEERRLWMLADFASRVVVPIAFDAVGAPEWATLLREGPEVVDAETCGEAESKCRFAQDAAYAAADAADAAYAAAYAYAAAAAADAAYAAYAYPAYAAYAAAYAYPAYAAYAAYAAAYAYAAAAAAAKQSLRDGWLALLDRMIKVTEVA